jgi:hypothetical protein
VSIVALAVAGLAICCVGAAPARAEAVGEHKLKSAFLYNFTKFVEWRAERFASASDPIVIGLLADEAMRKEVVAISANRQVNGRSLSVRRIETPADLQAAHVVYVDAAAQSRYDVLRKDVQELEALVVGDGDGCAAHEDAICFVQRDGKLRFEINATSAERARVKISAQLQKLALAVHRGT